jgi:hypothetical protein
VLLGFYLYGAIMRARAQAAEKARDESAPAEVRAEVAGDRASASLEEIERLAGEGAFSEAVHLLLLRCFEHLRRRIPDAGQPALTSREFLDRAELPPAVQDRLSFIVAAVEVGYFGGKPVGIDVYRRCLDGYRDITAPEAS